MKLHNPGAWSIPLNSHWGRASELDIVTRAKMVISGYPDGPFLRDNGYPWQIDSSNDWWAEIKDGHLIVAYRYFHSIRGEQKLLAVANCLQFIFDDQAEFVNYVP